MRLAGANPPHLARGLRRPPKRARSAAHSLTIRPDAVDVRRSYSLVKRVFCVD